MPENSAFDVADALGRLMNNKKLYEKLLGKFVAGYSDFAGQVQAAIDGRDLENGVHLAHTMKGLAGNLGATDLQEASRALEMKFREGDAGADFAPLFEKFTSELSRALDEAKAGVDMG